MTNIELKWYITLQVGSKVNKTVIKKNEKLYKTLANELNTTNIDDMIKFLYALGFVIKTGGRKSKVEYETEPKVNISYVQPSKTIKQKQIIQHKDRFCFANL